MSFHQRVVVPAEVRALAKDLASVRRWMTDLASSKDSQPATRTGISCILDLREFDGPARLAECLVRECVSQGPWDWAIGNYLANIGFSPFSSVSLFEASDSGPQRKSVLVSPL